MEKKLADEIKAREQLQTQNENLHKLIRLNYSEVERTIKVKIYNEMY